MPLCLTPSPQSPLLSPWPILLTEASIPMIEYTLPTQGPERPRFSLFPVIATGPRPPPVLMDGPELAFMHLRLPQKL